MKRLISAVLVLVALSAFAYADTVDLSFAELRTLQQQVAKEMTKRPEWKEVKVPKGFWRIGVDIPAGEYCIELQDKRGSCYVGLWGYARKDYETNGGLLCNMTINSSAPSIGRIELVNGALLELTAPVIIKPVEGLGF